MIDAVVIQRVRRRKRFSSPAKERIRQTNPGFFSGKFKIPSAGSGFHWKASLNFIDRIEQNPAPKRRRVQKPVVKSGFTSRDKKSNRSAKERPNTGHIHQEVPLFRGKSLVKKIETQTKRFIARILERKEKLRFTIPPAWKLGPKRNRGMAFFSLLPIILLGGLPAGSFIVFHPPWVKEASITPPADTYIRHNLAVYAGLHPVTPNLRTDELMALDLKEAFAWESYTVKRGDSVSKIAAAHVISIDAIIASNNITNARQLAAGEKIRIPNMDGIPYTVRQGDSLSRIAFRMGVPLEAILDANDVKSENIMEGTVLFIPGAKMRQEDLKKVLGEQQQFIYPMRGRLTSSFGWRKDPFSGQEKHHGALDLAAAIGTPVKAAMDGRVVVVGIDRIYGKYIILTHENRFQTMYAHLNAFSVKQGEVVKQGNKIGEVGNTGYSTGPHLHFAVFKNNRPINPLELLSR